MPSGGVDTVPVDPTKITMVTSPVARKRWARRDGTHLEGPHRPAPDRLVGAVEMRESAGGEKAEEVECREIGRMRRPMRNQTRDDVGVMLPEGVHLGVERRHGPVTMKVSEEGQEGRMMHRLEWGHPSR